MFFAFECGAAQPTPLPSLSPALAPMSSDQVFQELKEGNLRFVEGKGNTCSTANAVRAQVASAQFPRAAVLSCSDSRVPPEQVFDQDLGKLFVVRLAGNVLNGDAIASFEYAVTKLGTRLLIVLGHESCGAVKAAIETPKGKDAGSPNLNFLLAQIRSNLDKKTDIDKGIPADPKVRHAVMKNVSAVARELLRRSPVLSKAVANGDLRIIDGIYDLETGLVDFWDGSGAK